MKYRHISRTSYRTNTAGIVYMLTWFTTALTCPTSITWLGTLFPISSGQKSTYKPTNQQMKIIPTVLYDVFYWDTVGWKANMKIFAVIMVELIPQKYYLQKSYSYQSKVLWLFSLAAGFLANKNWWHMLCANTAFYIHFFMANVFYQGKGEGYLIIQVAHCSKRVT